MLNQVEVQDLINRAKAKATGTNIHGVLNVAGSFYAAWDYCNNNYPGCLENYHNCCKPYEHIQETSYQYLERYERILRAFCWHGDLERARKDNPPGSNHFNLWVD